MKKTVLALIIGIISLVLFSCNLEFIEGEENINDYIFPYLEFTPTGDGETCTASVVEGATLEEIYIPSEVVVSDDTLKVVFFNGFQNPEDAGNLKTITLESNETGFGDKAFDGADNLQTILIDKEDAAAYWGKLPEVEKPGKEFDGWYIEGTDVVVREGDRIIVGHTTIVPRWKDHILRHFDAVASGCFTSGTKAHYRCQSCEKIFLDEAALEEVEEKDLIVAAAHKLTYVEGKAATCTESGIAPHYTCSVCSRSYSDEKGENYLLADDIELAAHGHNAEMIDKVDATCTEDGHSAYYECSYCGKLFKDADCSQETTSAEVTAVKLDHDWTVTGQDAEGHWRECSRCHEKKDTASHTFDNGEETKAPTATEAGTKTYTCSCGYKKTEDIPPTGEHHWSVKTTVAPTCTEYGYTTYVCTDDNCGHKYNGDYTAPAGHSFIEHEYNVTCARTDIYYECTVCGKYFESCGEHEIAKPVSKAESHVWGREKETADGNAHVRTCILCGAKDSEKAHVYTEVKENRAIKASRTCTHGTIYYKSCVCGKLSSETFEDGEGTGHVTAVKVDEVASNCTVKGHRTYYICTNECCSGKYFSDELLKNEVTYDSLLLPLSTHVFDSKTFRTDGEKHTWICDVCHAEIKTENHRKTYKHDFNQHWMSCDVCGYSTQKEAHTMTGEDGNKICKTCGYVEAESQNDGSSFEVEVVDKSPHGKLTAVKGDGTKWTFTLTSTNENAVPDTYTWYVDNVEQKNETNNTFVLDAPGKHSYRVLCVFSSGGRYSSESMTITGG